MKKITIVLAVIILSLAMMGAARWGIVQAIQIAQYIQLVDTRTGCILNYLPEQNKYYVADDNGDAVFVGGQHAAVYVLLNECR